jgi:outer membrane lipoprotein LolB
MGNWEVAGKIGITTPKESVAGFIQWQQTGEQFDVYVSGPLSVGSTRITGNSNNISITQGGKTSHGIDPQALIYEQLGWHFPIQNLPYWIKGLAAPNSKASVSKDSNGRVNKLSQDKWLVTYPRYNEYYEQPSKIKISKGQWKFLIVIKNWSFDS